MVRVPSRWVTSWVTTDAAETGRPRTMVDRSGSSAQLFAQLIDAWSFLRDEAVEAEGQVGVGAMAAYGGDVR